MKIKIIELCIYLKDLILKNQKFFECYWMAFATTVLNFSNVDCIFTQILKHLFKGIRDSKFNITQCDVFDKNGIQSLNTLKKFITTVMRSSFNADKISFKLLGALGNVSMLDILALS